MAGSVRDEFVGVKNEFAGVPPDPFLDLRGGGLRIGRENDRDIKAGLE
jgi:hypothetical protein